MRESDRDDVVRAFIAAEPDAPVRRAVEELLRALRAAPGAEAVRWVPTENLHVTLRFLGPVAAARIPELASRVRAEVGALRPFALRLGALSGFPSPRRPRVLVLGLEPEAPLLALSAAVERGVVAAGFAPETRPFRPHLTLGRVRPGRRPPPVTAPVTAEGEAFEVGETILFRSDLGPRGATHIPLERMALGGAVHP